MAIGFGHVGTGTRDNFTTTTMTWQHDCTGDNELRVVVSSINHSQVAGITYNGVALTFIDEFGEANSGGFKLQLWGLHSPASGNNNCVLTKNTAGDQADVCSVSWSGVDGSAYFDTGSYLEGNAIDSFPANPGDIDTTTAPTNANCWGVFVVRADNPTTWSDGTVGTGTQNLVKRQTGDVVGQFAIFDTNGTIGTGTQHMHAAMTPSGFSYVTVRFALAPAASGSPSSSASPSISPSASVSRSASPSLSPSSSVSPSASPSTSVSPSVSPSSSVSRSVSPSLSPSASLSPSSSASGSASPSGPSTITVTANTIFPASTPAKLIAAQRTGATSAIAIAGTWTGTTPTGFQANWQGGSYAALTGVTVGAGTWSGTLPAYAVGDGTLNVRFTNETATTTAVRLTVGDIFLVWGDSTVVSATNSAVSGTPVVWEFDKAAHQWFLTTSNGTSQWPYVMEQLRADQSCPMMYVVNGVGGSRLLQAWQPTQGSYDAAVAAALDSKATAFAATLGQITCNDCQSGTTPSTAAIAAGLDATAAGYAADLPGAPPTFNWMWSELPFTAWGGNTAAFRADVDGVRQGILNAVTASDIFIGANVTGYAYADGEHPVSDADKQANANWWYPAIKTSLYGGGPYRGPRVTSISANLAKTIFTITFNQTLANSVSSSVDGFRVVDGAGTVATIVTALVVSATQVALTVTWAPPVSGATVVSFASSQDAISGTLPTSVAINLPDTTHGISTVQIPAEPFFGVAVASPSPSASASPSASPSLSPSASASPSISASSSVSRSVSPSLSPSSSVSASSSPSLSPSSSPSLSASPSLSPSSSASASASPSPDSAQGHIGTYNRAVAITKSDTVNYDGSTYSAAALTRAIPAEAIYVGGAGVVASVFENGSVVNFTANSGQILPLKTIRVNSANTTATGLIALYLI